MIILRSLTDGFNIFLGSMFTHVSLTVVGIVLAILTSAIKEKEEYAHSNIPDAFSFWWKDEYWEEEVWDYNNAQCIVIATFLGIVNLLMAILGKWHCSKFESNSSILTPFKMTVYGILVLLLVYYVLIFNELSVDFDYKANTSPT